MKELIEQTIEDHKELIQLVPYDPKVNFPDTVTRDSVFKFYENDQYIEWDQYDKHIGIVCLFDDDNKNIPIVKLVENFLFEAKIRNLDLSKAKPLPHLNWSHVFYSPVLIKKIIPVRLIISYSIRDQANLMSLDTIISTKSWREEKGLL